MKNLYIDIDGVLLTPKHTRAADFVIPFLDFAVKSFECFWLTTHCNGDAAFTRAYLLPYLRPEALPILEAIKPTVWHTFKTEAIDWDSDFYWLNDNPLLAEKNILIRRGQLDHLIVVDLARRAELKRLKSILEKWKGIFDCEY